MEYVVSLDLGQAQDYSALAVLERSEQAPPAALLDPTAGKVGHYAVRYLKRWPLGTPYPLIVQEVSSLLERPPLPGCTLAVDATGVGRAVVDLFRQADLPASLVPITITAGHQASREGAGWHVAKKHLAGALQVLLQQQRLKVAPLPEREVLLVEMRAFRVKVSAATGNETFEAWRERDHDDLVLAVAMACWLGERGRPPQALRVVRYMTGERRPPLRIVACSREELAALELGPHRALLVSVTDPGVPPPEPPQGVAPGDALALEFADLDPREHVETWYRPIEPYGLPADNLVMKREHGKRMWAHLRRRREPTPDLWVIQDGGDRRALSLAYALCDALGLPHQGTIRQAVDPDWRPGPNDAPPNRGVYEVARASRALVV